MRCCVLKKPGCIEIVEVADPEPGSGDLVIRVRAALTCGTDLKAYRRGHPKMPCPTRFGHEFSGEVVAAGSEVDGFAVGEAVMSANTGPCGHCFYCRHEQENLCETIMQEMILGAYGEYLRIPARVVRNNVYRKPDELSFEQAALLEPLSSVCHGAACLPETTENAVILGTGPVALLWLLVLKRRGLGPIAVAGRRPEKLAIAEALGADAAVIADERLEDAVGEIGAGHGPDAVIECTGAPEVWQRACGLVRRGGSVVLFGGCAQGTEVRLDTYRLHYDGVRIASPFHFRPVDVRAAYELLRGGLDGASDLIDANVGLDAVPRLFAAMAAGRPEGIAGRIKTAVLPQRSAGGPVPGGPTR